MSISRMSRAVAGRILYALEMLDRRKPQEQRRLTAIELSGGEREW